MFGVPTWETVAKELLQHGIRNKIPPTHGDNLCAFQFSFLPAKFDSLEDETFVLIMAVQNDDRAKSRRNIAGNDVLQVIRQNAPADIDGAGKTGTTPTVWQRPGAVGDRRRDNHLEPLDQHGSNADRNLRIHGQGQVWAMLLDGADR